MIQTIQSYKKLLQRTITIQYHTVTPESEELNTGHRYLMKTVGHPLGTRFQTNDGIVILIGLRNSTEQICLLNEDTNKFVALRNYTINSVLVPLVENVPIEPSSIMVVSPETLKFWSSMVNNPDNSDLTIKIGDNHFYAHKSILSSTPLTRFFRDWMVHEGKTSQMIEFDPEDIDSDSMLTILKYIYMGQIEINFDNCIRLMISTNFLCIESLLDLCESVLIDSINATNVEEIANFTLDMDSVGKIDNEYDTSNRWHRIHAKCASFMGVL